MKKKVFLITLMVLALCLMLSIGSFAKAYDKNRTSIEYTDTNGEAHSVPIVKVEATASEVASVLSNNATVQARFADNDAYAILADTNGKLTAFPTWYIIEPSGSSEAYVAISEIEYGFVNTLVEGSTFEKGAIRYIEFPQGMTAVRQNGVFGLKTNGNPYETNVTDFYIPKTVNSIEENAFNSMPNLKNVFIEAGNSISLIRSGTFSKSSVQYVQVENLTEITSIDGFTNCGITGDIDLSNCTKLITIQAGCFQDSTGIGKITLPDSIEAIKDYAFQSVGNGYLASPYLPANLKTVGQRFFAYCNAINDTFIFPEGVTSLGSEPFQDSKVAGGPTGKELNLVFLGKVTGCVNLNGNGHQKHAETVTVYFAQNSLSEYNTNGFYIKPSGSSTTSVPGAIRAVFCSGTGAGTNGSVTGVELVYITSTAGTVYTADMVNDATNGFDFDNHKHYGPAEITPATCGVDGYKGTSCIVCDSKIGEVLPATGDHTYEDDHICTTAEICTVCSQEVTVANAEHKIKLEITYASGYMQAGVRIATCENDGCEYCNTTAPQALFTLLGYSKSETGTGICVGYKIAYDEIAEFKSANGITTFEYGVVAGVSSLVPEAKPMEIVNGKVQAIELVKGKVVSVDISASSSLYQVDFRLMGFDGNEDLEVLMSAYVYDGTELSYLQKTQADTASAVTFNSL